MKQVEIETGKKWVATPIPSPPSVTKREIAQFWRQKRLNEEEHFLAAIKAAARIRARNFTEEEYKRFEESLEDDQISTTTQNQNQNQHGIKDWWTKSKYAYLNQPAEKDGPNKRNCWTYVPNYLSYKPTTTLLYPTNSVF